MQLSAILFLSSAPYSSVFSPGRGPDRLIDLSPDLEDAISDVAYNCKFEIYLNARQNKENGREVDRLVKEREILGLNQMHPSIMLSDTLTCGVRSAVGKYQGVSGCVV